jgi:uncharacterized protein YnzC (UPF0291/DUF896 family)
LELRHALECKTVPLEVFMMRRAVLPGLLLAMAVNVQACAIKTAAAEMTHMVVRLVEPKEMANKVMPKEYWFSGADRARIDEITPPKAEHKQTMFVIVPDFWQIDLPAKKGMEITGFKKDTRVSIFGSGPHFKDDPKFEENAKTLHSLSFGQELDFFKSHNAKKAEKKGSSGEHLNEYQLPIGTKVSIVLDTDAATNTPKRVSLNYEKQQMALKYDKYETAPVKDTIFAIPSGMKIDKMTAEEFKKKREALKEKFIEQIKAMQAKQMADMKKAPPAGATTKPADKKAK